MAVAITRPGADIAGVAASGTVASYVGVDIGAEAPDRIVVVCAGTELAASTPTAATIDYGIGAVAMTPGTSQVQGAVTTQLFYLHVATGTSATVNVTFGATSPTAAQNHIAVYRVVGGGVPVSSTGAVTDTDADPISSGALSIPTGGAGLAVYAGAAAGTARTWTGFTEDLQTNTTAFDFGTGTLHGAATPTITVSGGNNEDATLSWVIFGLNKTITQSAKFNNVFRFHRETVLHFDGTDASTSFPDTAFVTWTAGGNAQLDTAQFKFGTASALFDGTGDYIIADGSPDLAFRTEAFTIDFWVRWSALGTNTQLYDGRQVGGGVDAVSLYKATDNTLRMYAGSDVITGTTAVSADTWYHVALTRSGTSTRLFLNGTQEGSTYSDSTNYGAGTNRPVIGIDGESLSGNPFAGWIDELRINKGVAAWTANFTPPTAAYAPDPTVATGAGIANLTPSLFVNSNTFRTHTITTGAVNLAPALFSDADTFRTHTITQVTNLLANLYSDADTFYNHTITTGAVNLSPALFSDADTFRTHVITTGAVNLTASLYTDADTFYTHTVTTTYSLLPSLYSDADTFYTHTLTSTYSLLPSHYLNVNVFYDHTITTGGGGQGLAPSLYLDADTFYTHTITSLATIAPSLYSDADTFYQHTITTGAVSLAVPLYVNANVFYTATITTTRDVAPSLFSDADTFYTHTITTGAVNLAPPLFSDPDLFYVHTITQGFLLQPDLFLNTNVFYQHTITTGAVNLAPGLFSDADTFYQHTITTTYTLSPNLFTDADTFYTHTITATYNLLVGLFEDADQLYPPTVTVAGGTFNLDVPLLENQNTFYQHTLTGGQQGPQEGFGGPGPTAIRFSREDWRRLKKKWEEAARAQEAVERKAKEVTGKRREALAAAARAAEDAILEADEAETPPEGADTLTRLLRAAVQAKSLSDTVTAANRARDYAREIEAQMEEEEAVAILMMQ